MALDSGNDSVGRDLLERLLVASPGHFKAAELLTKSYPVEHPHHTKAAIRLISFIAGLDVDERRANPIRQILKSANARHHLIHWLTADTKVDDLQQKLILVSSALGFSRFGKDPDIRLGVRFIFCRSFNSLCVGSNGIKSGRSLNWLRLKRQIRIWAPAA